MKHGGFHGEKLEFIRTSQPLPKIAKNQKYSNPRISYDGKYWYLSIGYEAGEVQKPELSGESPLKECRNVERQNRKIRLLHRRITNIRINYFHQTTTAIVKTKPSQIVMETLIYSAPEKVECTT